MLQETSRLPELSLQVQVAAVHGDRSRPLVSMEVRLVAALDIWAGASVEGRISRAAASQVSL